jgi:hypothetical protein
LAGKFEEIWREKLYFVFLLSEFSEEDEEEDDEVLKLDVETKTFSQDIQVRSPPLPGDVQLKLCSLRPWQQEDGSAANEGPVRIQCKCLVSIYVLYSQK